jgi:hypothetical protein
MSYSHHIRSRLIRRVALGLAVAAVAAPSAAASGLSSLEVTPDGYLQAKTPPSTVVLPQIEVGPDGYLQAKSPPSTVVLPQIEVGPGGPAINWNQSQTDAPATRVSTPGFDYSDAGIGATITFGAALLGAAGLLALRRSRRSATLV